VAVSDSSVFDARAPEFLPQQIVEGVSTGSHGSHRLSNVRVVQILRRQVGTAVHDPTAPEEAQEDTHRVQLVDALQ
jgi:hypothetical protein